MLGIRALFGNLYVQIILQIIVTFLGFLLVAIQMNMQYFDTGGSVWNARLYGILGTILISSGTSFVGKGLIPKLKRFFITLGILLVCWTLVGGFFVLNDTVNRTEYVGGNIWISFDAMSGEARVSKIIRNAIFLALITGSIISAIYIYFRFKDRASKITMYVLAGITIFVLILYGLMFT